MPAQETKNNFVITGIPRSGTSLLCCLMNCIENVVCLNEIPAFYSVPNMPFLFHEVRSALRNGHPVPMRLGKLSMKNITDTQSQDSDIVEQNIIVRESMPLYTGSKINVPYLFQMDEIIKQGYKIIIVVRNPVYAIASWNKYADKINEAHVMASDFGKWPRYKDIKFMTKDLYSRQVELWNYLAQLILKLKMDLPGVDYKSHILLIRYEDLVADVQKVMGLIKNHLRIDEIKLKMGLPELSNMNRDSRFGSVDIDSIISALSKNRHMKKAYGY